MNGFTVLLGALASAAAIFTAAIGLARWIRQRWRRAHLGERLYRLRRLDSRTVALLTEIEARITEGVGWYGWAIWPPRLHGHLVYLEGMLDELEYTTAELRAFPADGAVERLRADLEELTSCFHEALELYRDGIVSRYRESEGCPVEPSATGREPTPILHPGDVHRVEDLRRRVQLFFRSAYYQLERESGKAEWYRTDWPTVSRAFGSSTEDQLWRGEIRPLEFSKTDLGLDD